MQGTVGIIGLGDMGSRIAEKLHGSGYSLVLYNRTKDKYKPFEGRERIRLAQDIDEFAGMLRAPEEGAIVWTMLPGGAVTNAMMTELSGALRPEDIVIDASNSVYVDSMANADALSEKSIFYLDVGFAGGPSDIAKGVAIMVGGNEKAYKKATPLFKALAGKGVYGYVGSSGSGHMAKLVHNVIFYGVNPIYVEGVELLGRLGSDFGGTLDMREALRLYSSAPPINGEIMGAIAATMEEGRLPEKAPEIKVSGMITWAMQHAEKLGVKMAITKTVIAGYASMSEKTRKIYYEAKRIVTGHY